MEIAVILKNDTSTIINTNVGKITGSLSGFTAKYLLLNGLFRGLLATQ